MAERKVKMKFLGTPYVLFIDHRSVTLKRENKPNDKFPTPLGYHRSFSSLVDTLFKLGFTQVKNSPKVKTFAEDFRKMWLEEVKPIILEIQENQSELTRELIEADRKRDAKLIRIAKLVKAGDNQGAAEIAKTLELD